MAGVAAGAAADVLGAVLAAIAGAELCLPLQAAWALVLWLAACWRLCQWRSAVSAMAMPPPMPASSSALLVSGHCSA